MLHDALTIALGLWIFVASVAVVAALVFVCAVLAPAFQREGEQ